MIIGNYPNCVRYIQRFDFDCNLPGSDDAKMLIYNIYTDSTEFIRKKSSIVGEGCDHFLFARGGWFTLLEPQKSDHTGIFQKIHLHNKIFKKFTGRSSNRKKRFKTIFLNRIHCTRTGVH